MTKAIIIVAGGSGTRMGSAIPKQFLMLAGKPILMQTIEVFFHFDKNIEIILVLPENQIGYWENLKREFEFDIPHKTTSGGAERFFSVKNGLSMVSEATEVIGIHDGVRPLVNQQTVSSCYEKAFEHGAAIPVIQIKDSIRKMREEGSKAVNRDDFCFVQTPQCFSKDVITKAYQQEFNKSFTDDASVAEAAGFHIQLTPGNTENIKITSPSDLIIAEQLLKIC
jgi:2-C-methyl-D-erythritol 4-phosphate cytidylyltransferase